MRRATSVTAHARRGGRDATSTTGWPMSPPSDTAPSIGTSPTSGAPVSAASRRPPPDPKIAWLGAVGRDERVHVLDHAEHLEVGAARHVGDARGDLLRALRGSRDHEHLGLRQQARERHLDVAGAGRHVDEQVVEIAPPHVDEELLERLGEDQAAPHERGVLVVDEQAHADDLELPGRPRRSDTRAARILPVPSGIFEPARRACTPSMRGIENPQMSASSTPTVSPRAASAAATFAVIEDLPTPPLPLPTAMTRVVADTSVGGAELRSLPGGRAASRAERSSWVISS